MVEPEELTERLGPALARARVVWPLLATWSERDRVRGQQLLAVEEALERASGHEQDEAAGSGANFAEDIDILARQRDEARAELERLRERQTDLLGWYDRLLTVHSHVNMDTDDDRALHADTVETFTRVLTACGGHTGMGVATLRLPAEVAANVSGRVRDRLSDAAAQEGSSDA